MLPRLSAIFLRNAAAGISSVLFSLMIEIISYFFCVFLLFFINFMIYDNY